MTGAARMAWARVRAESAFRRFMASGYRDHRAAAAWLAARDAWAAARMAGEREPLAPPRRGPGPSP